MSIREWCSYWYVLIFINFIFKVRYMYCNKFNSWFWNSNMTAVFAGKNWLSFFVMRYLDFSGWNMISSKRQNGYLNQWVILSRLQYETRSLQMWSTKRTLYWCVCCTRTTRSHQRPPSWLNLPFHFILFVRCLIITLL